mmetsp:Transcript_37319/g.60684  ORF Transcript_37319/g.60684 Transcript_37319/m.60684 type:complete len:241 (-) Transcript_37319:36-758(-)
MGSLVIALVVVVATTCGLAIASLFVTWVSFDLTSGSYSSQLKLFNCYKWSSLENGYFFECKSVAQSVSQVFAVSAAFLALASVCGSVCIPICSATPRLWSVVGMIGMCIAMCSLVSFSVACSSIPKTMNSMVPESNKAISWRYSSGFWFQVTVFLLGIVVSGVGCVLGFQKKNDDPVDDEEYTLLETTSTKRTPPPLYLPEEKQEDDFLYPPKNTAYYNSNKKFDQNGYIEARGVNPPIF